MFKNVASQKMVIYAWDTVNRVAKTGDAANITAQISKDCGAAAAMLAGDQLTGVKARVSKIEDKIDSQVGYGRCKDMRGECNERIISQLQEMARQISNNRDTVISQMRETEKFIGRVEQHLIKNGG
jgi:tryptophanyl-tRNA synthetase